MRYHLKWGKIIKCVAQKLVNLLDKLDSDSKIKLVLTVIKYFFIFLKYYTGQFVYYVSFTSDFS